MTTNLDQAVCVNCGHSIHENEGVFVHEDGAAICPNAVTFAAVAEVSS